MVNILTKAPNMQPYLVDVAKPVAILTAEMMREVGGKVASGELPKHHDADAVMGNYADLVPSYAYQQALGYVNTTLILWETGEFLVQWRHPEDGLHPKHQIELADVLVRLHHWQESHHPTTEQTKQDLLKLIERALSVHDNPEER
jgi:hypothetical protein